ncbi:hypothetical protein CPB84DRAFT_1748504 [Gymnopilus junonius]|uniref:Uncharacterized protein n=1 Tax=Gymnopilus junonius TaxID=109634 RepID=A0A9P5NLV7_GYMJU|nr:hypothetical protein CPB84DRAFT_1748504 [Gymnopilus junonius]
MCRLRAKLGLQVTCNGNHDQSVACTLNKCITLLLTVPHPSVLIFLLKPRCDQKPKLPKFEEEEDEEELEDEFCAKEVFFGLSLHDGGLALLNLLLHLAKKLVGLHPLTPWSLLLLLHCASNSDVPVRELLASLITDETSFFGPSLCDVKKLVEAVPLDPLGHCYHSSIVQAIAPCHLLHIWLGDVLVWGLLASLIAELLSIVIKLLAEKRLFMHNYPLPISAGAMGLASLALPQLFSVTFTLCPGTFPFLLTSMPSHPLIIDFPTLADPSINLMALGPLMAFSMQWQHLVPVGLYLIMMVLAANSAENMAMDIDHATSGRTQQDSGKLPFPRLNTVGTIETQYLSICGMRQAELVNLCCGANMVTMQAHLEDFSHNEDQWNRQFEISGPLCSLHQEKDFLLLDIPGNLNLYKDFRAFDIFA